MTATVRVYYTAGCQWTGSLMDLSCCEPKELQCEVDTVDYLNWGRGPTSRCTSNDESLAFHSSSDEVVSVTSKEQHTSVNSSNFDMLHLLKFRQLLKILNQSTSVKHLVDVEQSRGSSYFEWVPLEQMKTLLKNLSRSEPLLTELGSMQEQTSPFSDELLNFSRPRRRHCSSESDLSYTKNFLQKPLPELSLERNTSVLDADNGSEMFPYSKPLSESAVPQPEKVEERLHDNEDLNNHCIEKNDAGTGETILQMDQVELSCHCLEIAQKHLNPASETAEHSVNELQQDQVISTSQNETESQPCVTDNEPTKTPQSQEDSVNLTGKRKLPKVVSFADEVGRSLTEIFVLDDTDCGSKFPACHDEDIDDAFLYIEEPDYHTYPGRFTRSRPKQHHYPQHSFGSSLDEQKNSSNQWHVKAKESTATEWVACFFQPASQYLEFRQRLETQCVSLESMSIRPPLDSCVAHLPHLSGTIKVKNIAFEKGVWLRVTLDNWKSSKDYEAVHNAEAVKGTGSASARFDTFNFNIPLDQEYSARNQIARIVSIQFAIHYRAGPGGTCGDFWDNNNGINYAVERRNILTRWLGDRTDVRGKNVGVTDGSLSVTSSAAYTLDFRPNFDNIISFTNYRAWNHFAGERGYY